MSEQNKSEFQTVDELANNQKLIKIYQIQVNDASEGVPVFLGMYPDVPLPINKILNYKNHNLHIVTYVMTESEIKENIYKIIGINIFEKGNKSSLCSLDLTYNPVLKQFELVFSDHVKKTLEVVEKLEKFPGKENVMEYILEKVFEDPIKSIIV
jgi:hypothetical protein